MFENMKKAIEIKLPGKTPEDTGLTNVDAVNALLKLQTQPEEAVSSMTNEDDCISVEPTDIEGNLIDMGVDIEEIIDMPIVSVESTSVTVKKVKIFTSDVRCNGKKFKKGDVVKGLSQHEFNMLNESGAIGDKLIEN